MPAAAAQRTIQRLNAWPSRIRPNSSSESAGISPAARCADETIGPTALWERPERCVRARRVIIRG